MNVHEREPGDAARLKGLIDAETDANQRDRYRMALWAIRGNVRNLMDNTDECSLALLGASWLHL